jgi:lysozyme family protein
MADPPIEKLAPEYAELWKNMQVRPGKEASVKSVANRIAASKAVYEAVTAQIGVPWVVVGIIHSLEADNNMGKHLHNGNPLTGRTTDVPSGRPPGNPPFTWEVSAIDALKLKKLDTIKDWPLERIAYELERYNGWGYRNLGGAVKSPYLWSFSNHHLKGKFIRDHVFNPEAPSSQVGGMLLLKELMGGEIAIPSTPMVVQVNTRPIVTDFFLPLGPFELLPTKDAPQTENGFRSRRMSRVGKPDSTVRSGKSTC